MGHFIKRLFKSFQTQRSRLFPVGPRETFNNWSFLSQQSCGGGGGIRFFTGSGITCFVFPLLVRVPPDTRIVGRCLLFCQHHRIATLLLLLHPITHCVVWRKEANLRGTGSEFGKVSGYKIISISGTRFGGGVVK